MCGEPCLINCFFQTNERILNSKMEKTMRKEELEQNAGKVMALNQEKEKLLK